MQRMHIGRLAVVGIGALASSASAAPVVVLPTSAADNSSFQASNNSTQTINGSSFTAANQAIIANGQPEPSTWPSSNGGFPGNYVSAQQGPANTVSTSATVAITYTLSASSVDIAKMHYWWYDGDQAGRDLSQLSLSFSADNVTYSTPQVFGSLPKETADNQPNAGINLVLSSPALGVKFAKITNMTNYGTPDTFASFFGIQEVRFVTTPEPTSAVLMVPLALLALRRRSRGR